MTHDMRRKDKQITDEAAIGSIVRRARVCRLAVSDDGQPYVVPLCFGYKDGALYFHSAGEGRKIDILRRNSRVCVEFDIDTELVTNEQACQCTMRYRSVIAFGKASFVEDVESKREALDILMSQYSDRSWAYSDEAVGKVAIIRVDIESMTGKQSGY